jgi:hypothetical protein
MVILFTLTVIPAIIFYLYVLVHFRREERRLKRGNQKTPAPVLLNAKAAKNSRPGKQGHSNLIGLLGPAAALLLMLLLASATAA